MSTPTVAASKRGVRAVALFEAAKGTLVLMAGFGLFALVHHGTQIGADRLVERFHLNPASRYPHIFIHAMDAMTDRRLWLLAGGAAAYSLLRLVEAYGLWRNRRWAEWLAVLSGGIYLPIETYELWHGFSLLKVCMFLFNVAIVGYMSRVLWRRKHSDSFANTP